jgi:two-component system, sensor histidine kinase and response regulator
MTRARKKGSAGVDSDSSQGAAATTICLDTILQDVLDTIPVRVFWKDTNGVYLGCNKLFARDAGKKFMEEIVGKTDYDMGWRDQADTYRRDDKEVMESGLPKIDYEEPQTTPGGELIWLRTSKIPLRDSAGKVYGVLGTYENITERKRTELALRKSEEKLRHLAENIQAVFWLKEGGEIVYISPAYERIWGLSLEHFTRHDSFMDALVPEDVDRVRKAFDAYLITGEFDEEFRIRRPDGEVRWIHSRSFPFCIDDDCSRSAGIAQDITERKRVEERLRDTEQKCRTVFEGAIESIYVHDFQGRFFEANRQAYEQLGYTKDELLRLSIMDVDGRSEKASEHLEILLEHGSHTFETELLRKDGSRFPVEINSQVIQYGGQRAILGVVRDITERKQMEQSLRNLADELEDRVRLRTLELEQANRAKTEFLANMSHEIRTPMAGVLGMTDLLLDQELSKFLRDDLKVIKSSAMSVLSLLNDMFDLSRIEQGRFELDPAEFDLRSMIREIMEQYEHEARAKNLEYISEIDQTLPEKVICDKNRLGQVIKNLLTNAIKFTQAGTVRLEARVLDRKEQSVRLLFTVTDTGIGIPQEHQESIFQPFSQIDPSYSKRYGGMGLGLTISRTLVKRMGGDIQVRSEPGRGTSFTFDVDCETVSGEAAPEKRSYTLADIPRLRILLAEDNPVNRLFLKRALTNAGHDVELARDGRQALEMNARHQFDLILMDIQMPEVNGINAAQRIRSGGHGREDVPIIALTAYAMKGDREKFLDAGMNGYLTKPVDFGELARVIVEVCRFSMNRAD